MVRRRLLIITLVVMGITVVAGGASICYLRFVLLKDMEDQLKGLENQIKQAKLKRSELPDLEKRLLSSRRRYEVLQNALPILDENEYDSLISTVEEMKKASGVTILGTKFSIPKAVPRAKVKPLPPGVQKAQFTFKVQGDFFQLLHFLSLIDNHQRFLEVARLKIGIAKGKELPKGSCKMSLDIFAYNYKAPLKKITPVEGFTGKTTPLD
jgi:Tfp pilus assembly protein PilO